MKINQGWLSGVEQIISPNSDSRPDDKDISLLLIHNISLPPGQFGGPFIRQLFTNCLDPSVNPYFAQISHLKVSSHLLIQRHGEIIQFVPFSQRAWHAGLSSFEGRKRCNDFSIGIELEGTDHIPYTDMQYQVLINITNVLIKYYPLLTPERVVGHSDVAPERKTDPGPVFDWERYKLALYKI